MEKKVYEIAYYKQNVSSGIFPATFLALFITTFFVYNDFNIRMIFGFAILFFIAMFSLIIKGMRVSINLTKVLLLFILFTPCISWVLSFVRGTQSDSVTIISLILSLVFALIVEPSKKDIITAFKIIQVFSIGIALYVIAVKIMPDIYWKGVRNILSSSSVVAVDNLLQSKYGVAIGGREYIANYVTFLGASIASYKMITSKREQHELIKNVLIFALCILSILIVNKKSEFLISLLVLGSLFYSRNIFLDYKNYKKWKKILILFIICILFSIPLLASNGVIDRYIVFFERIIKNISVGSDIDISSGRIELWKIAWNVFNSAPLIGVGWGSFSNYTGDTFNNINQGIIKNAHNNYLQVLAEMGVIGFVLFVIPTFIILYKTYKLLRKIRINNYDNLTTGCAITVSLSIQLYSILLSVVNPIWYQIIYWPIYAFAMVLLLYAEKDYAQFLSKKNNAITNIMRK